MTGKKGLACAACSLVSYDAALGQTSFLFHILQEEATEKPSSIVLWLS